MLPQEKGLKTIYVSELWYMRACVVLGFKIGSFAGAAIEVDKSLDGMETKVDVFKLEEQTSRSNYAELQIKHCVFRLKQTPLKQIEKALQYAKDELQKASLEDKEAIAQVRSQLNKMKVQTKKYLALSPEKRLMKMLEIEFEFRVVEREIELLQDSKVFQAALRKGEDQAEQLKGFTKGQKFILLREAKKRRKSLIAEFKELDA